MNVTRMDSHGGWLAIDRPRPVSEPCCGCPRNSGVTQTGNNQDDDDASTSIRCQRSGELCARMDGKEQRRGKLVAQWKSSRSDNDHGSDVNGNVLGSADEYTNPAFERDRCFAGPDDVEYGAVDSVVECMTPGSPAQSVLPSPRSIRSRPISHIQRTVIIVTMAKPGRREAHRPGWWIDHRYPL